MIVPDMYFFFSFFQKQERVSDIKFLLLIARAPEEVHPPPLGPQNRAPGCCWGLCPPVLGPGTPRVCTKHQSEGHWKEGKSQGPVGTAPLLRLKPYDGSKARGAICEMLGLATNSKG